MLYVLKTSQVLTSWYIANLILVLTPWETVDTLKAAWFWLWHPEIFMVPVSTSKMVLVFRVSKPARFCFFHSERSLFLVLTLGSGVDILNATWFWSARFLATCESQCTPPWHGWGPTHGQPVWWTLHTLSDLFTCVYVFTNVYNYTLC